LLRRAEQLKFRTTLLVPTAGLEPAQVAPLAPQTSASTNFATSALITYFLVLSASFPASLPAQSAPASVTA
jgi:hypothetical protein